MPSPIPIPKWKIVREFVAFGWGYPFYRIFSVLIPVLLGTSYVPNQSNSLFVSYCTIYALVFFFLELLVMRAPEEMRAKIRDEEHKDRQNEIDALKQDHQETVRKLSKSLQDNSEQRALVNDACLFLTGSFQKTTKVFDFISTAVQSKHLGVLKNHSVNKKSTITDVLKNICGVLKIISIMRHIPVSTVPHFRATYMQVSKSEGEEVLKYFAWATPGDHKPQSATLNKTLKKGEGMAGVCWQKKIVCLEPKTDGWLNLYDDQISRYKSIICIPVRALQSSGNEEIIGVITIDSQTITGFFGDPSRENKELWLAGFLPYCDYIGFVHSATNLAETLVPLLSKQMSEE